MIAIKPQSYRFSLQNYYLSSNRVITSTFWTDKMFPSYFIKSNLFVCMVCTRKPLSHKQSIFSVDTFSKSITSQDSLSSVLIFYCWSCCHVCTWSKNYISIKEVFATKMLDNFGYLP